METYHFPSLIWLLLASGITIVPVIFYSWKHRSMPGAWPFTLLMIIGFIWIITNAFEMVALQLEQKLFWSNIQYLWYSLIPVCWFILGVEFAGEEQWINRRWLAVLLIIPFLTQIIVWTNPYHGMIRQDVHLDISGPFPTIGKTYGPWIYVHAIYSYLLVFAGSYLLARTLVKSEPEYRSQPLVILIGIWLPALWNIAYILGVSPIPNHDLSPAVLSLTSIIMIWGLFRFRLFDIAPVAQDAVLLSIHEGVVIINAESQITAANPAACQLFNWSQPMSEYHISQAFESHPLLMDLLTQQQKQPSMPVEFQAQNRYFEVSISPLHDQFKRVVGKIIILHDITERKTIEKELLHLSITDPLTNLYNRRKFMQELQAEIERSKRYGTPLSLLMIDVDGLKRINDELGHLGGDEALRQIGLVLSEVRGSDITARFGGDEFVLLMASTDIKGAEGVAIRLMERIAKIKPGDQQSLSVSIGIASLIPSDNERGQTLLARADQAMYAAKKTTNHYVISD